MLTIFWSICRNKLPLMLFESIIENWLFFKNLTSPPVLSIYARWKFLKVVFYMNFSKYIVELVELSVKSCNKLATKILHFSNFNTSLSLTMIFRELVFIQSLHTTTRTKTKIFIENRVHGGEVASALLSFVTFCCFCSFTKSQTKYYLRRNIDF